jgi:hypothetical protein
MEKQILGFILDLEIREFVAARSLSTGVTQTTHRMNPLDE